MFWARSICNILLLFSLLHANPGHAAAPIIKPAFTLPDCTAHPYLVATSTEKAGMVTAPRGGFFCTSGDFQSLDVSRHGPIAALAPLIAGRTVDNIVLSAYMYGEPAMAGWLCSLPMSKGASIRILAQRTADGSGRVSPQFAKALEACAVPVEYVYYGCDVFTDDAMPDNHNSCKRGGVSVLHLKTLQLRFTDDSTILLLGSGNFNRSLFSNIEDWIIYAGAASHYFPLVARCAAEAAYLHNGPAPSANDLNGEMEACLGRWPAQQPIEGLQLEIAPMQGATFRKRLIDALVTADSIDIAAQALEDPELIAAINTNAKAKIRLVVDDDWYWALLKGADFYTANVAKIRWIQQLNPASVRYLQTNHANLGGTGNTLHTRMMIIGHGHTRTVFTGSAHFRSGSLGLNIEHLLTVSAPEYTQSYAAFFEALWTRGQEANALPLIDTPIAVPRP